MKFKKQIFKIKMLSVGFATLLVLVLSVTSLLYVFATTVTDDYTDELSVNELLGTEITGGELITDDVQGGDILLLDGVNDNVVVSDHSSIDMSTGDFSIAIRVKRTGSGTGDYVISKLDGGGSGYSIQVKDAAIRVVLNGSSGTYNAEFSTDTNTGEWVDVVWSVDKSESDGSKIYRNGQLIGSGNPSSTGNIDTSYALVMGEWKDGGGYYFQGYIADVRLYKSRALTAQEALDFHTYGVVDDTGLQAWWKLDEGTGSSATDSSSNSNTGTIDGATWMSGSLFPSYTRTTSINLLTASTSATLESFAYTSTKKPANANGRVQFSHDYDTDRENVLSFDGVDDYVDAGNSEDLVPSSSVTATAWFKADTVDGAGSNAILTRWGGGSAWSYIIRIYQGDIRGQVQNTVSGSGVVTGDAVSTGKWHFVAVRYDGSDVELFMDGVSQGTASLTGTINNPNIPVFIGSRDRGGAPDSFFDGEIADARVYAESLTDEELLDLYNHNIQPDDTNLEGWWKLDEGTGSSAADSSANSNTGTITGGSWGTDTNFASLIANWVNEDNAVIDDVGVYEFDGSDDYIEIDGITNDISSNTQGTISAWVKYNVGEGINPTILGANSSDDDSNGRLQFYIEESDNRAIIFFRVSGTNYIGWGTDNAITNSSSDWHHLAVSSDGGNYKFYVDGLEVPSSQTIQTGAGTEGAWFDYIDNVNFTRAALGGNRSPVGLTPFDGSLSDVRIYSEALSATEIFNLYAYATEPDDTNLEGHWKMNGNALDSSANGNDGTVSGAVANTNWNAKPAVGYSLLTDSEAQTSSFDGTNDEINFGTDASLDNPTNKTISLWFYADDITPSSKETIISKLSSSYGGWLVDLDTDGTVRFIEGYNSSDGAWSSDVSISEGWHHYAVTHDNSSTANNPTVYLDGEEVSTTETITPSGALDDSTTNDVIVGARGRDGTSDRFWDGGIANVALFDDILTSSEIRTLYLQGYVPTDHDHIVSYWALDGDYTDSVGSNDGTNSGSTVVKDIRRPQPEEPAQQTIDITNIGPMVGEFDGSDDYISISDNDALSFGNGSTDSAVSMSAWINMDDATRFRIFSKGADGGDREYIFNTDASDYLWFEIYGNTDNDRESIYVSTPVTAYEDQWIHVAATYDGRGGSAASDGIAIYINGSLQTITKSDAGTYDAMDNEAQSAYIGRRFSNSNYANGSINNVAVWSDVRTTAEILTEYQNQYIDTSDANLVSYWPLAGDYDDDVGTNHGTATGGPTFSFTTGAPGLVNSFNYRTFFTTDDGLGSYALGEITLTATTTSGAAAEAAALVASTYGRQISYATTTTDIQLGGAFSFINESSTSTIDSIKFNQVGSLSGDYIDDFTLNYYTETATTSCPTTQPGAGLSTLGSASDFVNASTTITTNLDVGPNRVCIYPTYSLASADEYTEIGKSIDIVISTSTDITTTDDISMEAEPLNVYGQTILAQAGVQSVTVAAADDTETTIYVENQALYKKVGSAAAVRLTSNDVKVIYAKFTDISGDEGRGQVRVELRLQYDGYNYVGSPVIQNYVTTVSVGR